MSKNEILHLLETEYLNGDIDIYEVKRRIGVYLNKSSDDTFRDLGLYDEFKKIQNKRRGLSAKKTNIKKYGVANGHNEIAKEKLRQTSLKKYGTEHPFQSEQIKEKCSNTKDKRYNNKHYTNREKCFATTKAHGMYRTKLEDKYLDKLKEKYPNIIQHYVSDRYPFECDFYIPSLDLYIELNVFYLHGGHFFDETNLDDINKLNEWKSKNIDTTIWTVKDIIKRNFAIRNKLNYLVLWSEKELKEFLDDNYTLVDTSINIKEPYINKTNKNQCQICGMIHHNISGHVRNFHKMHSKDYYDKYVKQENEGICPVCGKQTNYVNSTVGYYKHCSTKCSTLDPEVQEKLKQTCLDKYNCENHFQNQDIINTIRLKSKQTKLNRPRKVYQSNRSKMKSQFELDNDCTERNTRIKKYGYG